MLSYVDSEGEVASGHFMQAVVDLDRKRVLAAVHIDASDVAQPVTVPASSVTAGLANVRGVVHNSIEARATWTVERDGVNVPVQLIRIVPGANLVEVDEDAELATTTHGLPGYEITITQTDGANTHSVRGAIGPANLAVITELDSLVADRETVVHIGPPIAAQPLRSMPTPPAGTLRLKSSSGDLTLTNGAWTGTGAFDGSAKGARCIEEIVVCAFLPVATIITEACIFMGPILGIICSIVTIVVFALTCYILLEVSDNC